MKWLLFFISFLLFLPTYNSGQTTTLLAEQKTDNHACCSSKKQQNDSKADQNCHSKAAKEDADNCCNKAGRACHCTCCHILVMQEVNTSLNEIDVLVMDLPLLMEQGSPVDTHLSLFRPPAIQVVA